MNLCSNNHGEVCYTDTVCPACIVFNAGYDKGYSEGYGEGYAEGREKND